MVSSETKGALDSHKTEDEEHVRRILMQDLQLLVRVAGDERNKVPFCGESEDEGLLAELLATNEQLLDALKMYDDLLNQEQRDREKAEHKVGCIVCTLPHPTFCSPLRV